MRLPAFLALAAALAAPAPVALAVPVRGLYEASAPVADQGAPAREPALRSALQQVLVRLVGQRQLPEAALALLPRASTLVQGYGYETAPATRELRLKAQFDGRALEAALRAQGLPVWGANRPAHLVWLALRDDTGARLVLDETTLPERAAAVVATAAARGLPLVLPAPTPSERQRAGFGDIWEGRSETVLAVSSRYASDAVVIARVGREGSRWIGRWTLLDGKGLSEDWTATGASLDEALTAGVDQLADRQAARLAAQTAVVQDLQLHVRAVDALRDYGRLLNYVRSLTRVRQAAVERAQGDTLVMRLRIEGERDALERTLDSGGVLRRDPEAPRGDVLGYVLVH